MIASTVTLFFLALVTYFSYRIYIEYQKYIDPSNVYGDWIEIGAPPYQTEILTLSDKGVYRNNRLIATSYQFNGKRITIETGIGLTVYQLAGNANSPQLRRIVPDSPTQRLVKKGYEDTILQSVDGAVQDRRQALREHFNISN
ncbi:hypothetical protein BOO30_12105 [Vibrio navarrensis]|nr:hypothetical protein [Vibrio navarrensis]MBE4572357.1 hypothetical protein [Vibrio navarrensis]MBE4578467.1 hypothetical protein [Vibrio navarrensis]MBE4597135.1 hypothetical protein [Vibrio navarrensis]MBE4600373.1 hypothetical protein [Vibrio navarrensis]